MLNKHPTPEMLADYVAGSLRLSHALCVATHLELCESCRQNVERLESLGGHLLEQPAEPKSDQDLAIHNEALGSMKDSIMSILGCEDDVSTESGVKQPVSASQGAAQVSTSVSPYKVPKSLGQFIQESYEQLQWSAISPSIKIAVLCKDKDGSQVALTRVKPGGKMPHHAHTGDEVTVVLEGSFSDEDGLYKKGDIICRDAKDKHTPIVTKDGECICLAVLDGPIQFTGFFARLLNPFVRWSY